MQNRDELITTVAAFLKDRDEAFIVSEEQTDEERRDSAAALVAMLEPSPRVQALEEAAKIAFDVSENGEYHGEASVDSTSSIYQQGAFEVYEAIRALSSQPVADHIADAAKMVADGCKAYVGEMQTSSGTDYFVMIKSGGRELSIRKHQWKHHADYEAAEYNWLFNGGEKPDILEYRPLPASPEVSG